MNKIFKFIGLMCLMCISFIYTEKSAQVVREKDPIMLQIEENKEVLKSNSIDANIDGKNIVPGYYGMEVNVSESYENMKKYGLYNETMMKFKDIKPNVSIEDIYDKYIVGGNKSKNAVSFILKVDENTNIDKILEILERTNTTATFFMDYNFIEKNTDLIDKIRNLGCEIEHINYEEEEIVQVNKSLSKLDITPKYCYADNYNDNIINTCKMYSMHTIKPQTLSNITTNIKKLITPGAIINIKVSKELYQSLEYIISYTYQKGLNILTLDEHLSEKRLEKNLQ